MIFVEVEVSKVSSIRTGIYQDIEKTDPKINLPLPVLFQPHKAYISKSFRSSNCRRSCFFVHFLEYLLLFFGNNVDEES